MSPVIQLSESAMAELAVDVPLLSDFDVRSTRARLVRCPSCGARYDQMEWAKVAEHIPILVCQCGERFELTSNRAE